MRAVPLMKTCEKLCEKIENRNPVSWNDVVQTCLAVCCLSWLDMLQRRPPDTCSSSVGSLALWLSQRLLLCVGEALCQRRPPKVLWSVCLACWTMCTAWLFPGDRKMAEKQRSYWTFVGFLLLQSELALVARPFRKKSGPAKPSCCWHFAFPSPCCHFAFPSPWFPWLVLQAPAVGQ